MRKVYLLDKISEIVFIFTVFFMPLVFFGGAADPFWVIEKFFFKTMMSVLAIIWVIRQSYYHEAGIRKNRVMSVFLIFLAVTLLGFFKASNKSEFADKYFINILYMASFYFSYLYCLENPGNRKRLVITALISVFVMSIYGAFQSMGIDFVSWKTTFDRRAASTLGNPNFLAGHIVLLLPVAYSMIFASKSRTGKMLSDLAALVMTAVLMLTQTRGAYIAFFISAFIFIVLMVQNKKDIFMKHIKMIVIAIAIILTGVVLYAALQPEVRAKIKSAVEMKDESARIRMHLWKNTLYMIKDNPLLGTGAGNFYIKYSYYQYRSLSPEQFEKIEFYKSSHAHNDYLQFVAEYGIIGGGLFIFVLFLMFKGLFAALKREDGLIVIGVISGFAGIMIHAFFNFPFLIIPTTGTLFIIAGAFIKNEGDDRPVEVSKAAGNSLYLIIPVALLLILLSFQDVVSSSYLRDAKKNVYFKKTYPAMESALRAVSIDPYTSENFVTLGDIYMQQGDEASADNYLRKAYLIDRGEWNTTFALYSIALDRNDKISMLEFGKNLYDISPYAPKSITSYGYALFVNDRSAEAVTLYEKGITLWKDNAEMMYHLSAVSGSAGDYQKALLYAQKAIDLGFDSPGAYYNLAVSYYQGGNTGKSLEVLNTMKEKFPEDERAENLIKVIRDASKK